MPKHILPVVIFAIAVSLANAQCLGVNMIEQWGIYQVTLDGPDTGNPFTDVQLTAEFIVSIRIKETFFSFCNRMCLLWHIQQIYANAF